MEFEGITPVRAAGAVRTIDDLPGPPGLPLIGNLLQVRRGRVHQHVEAWCRQYGPYFRFSLGGRRFLVVADHEALGGVLRDRPDGFRRSRRFQQVAQEMGLDPGVFAANGDDWQRQRRMVMAGFDPGHVKAYFPSLMKVTQRLQERWQRAASAGAWIDLQADLMRYTVDAISGLAFGADINTLESDDEVIQHHLNRIFPAIFKRMLSPLPYWRYVRFPSDRRLERSVAEIKVTIRSFIEQARARLTADPSLREHPGNLLEAMIVAADSSDGRLSDREIAGNVMTMLLAGEDTTANTLAWMIHLLERHPQALRRARDEVRRVNGDLRSALTLEQINALEFVEACAHETMRLKPVAPFIAQEALRDTRIADIHVPAGTIIWGVLRHDSVSDRHFPNALAFEPQRWLGERSEGYATSSAKRVSMPFGAGPRVCPGRYLALLEIKMAMAMLLRRFDIESVVTPDGAEAEEAMAVTMAPVGLRMKLRERVEATRSTTGGTPHQHTGPAGPDAGPG